MNPNFEPGAEPEQNIRYSRGRNIHDNRPEQRTAACWDDFLRVLEADRAADIADEFGDAVLVDASTFRGEQPVFLPPPGGPLACCYGPPLDVDAYLQAKPAQGQVLTTNPAVDPETGEVLVRKVNEGGRHAHLVRVAGGLNSRGLVPVAILAALMAENEANCEPPLPEAEVERIFRDIVRRYSTQHGQAAAARFLPPLDDDEGQPPGEWPDPILPGVKPPPWIAFGPELRVIAAPC